MKNNTKAQYNVESGLGESEKEGEWVRKWYEFLVFSPQNARLN